MKCISAQGDSLTRAVNSSRVPPNSRTRMSSICNRTGRGVAVAGHVDQARDEVLQPIGAQEQQRAPLGSQIHHRFGHRQKPFGAQREQLRARDGLDDVEQQLARVDGVAVGHRERLADPARDRRDFQDVGVHGGDGEEPDEAVLDNAVVAVGVFANRDRVRVSAVAQVAADDGLGQHQQIGRRRSAGGANRCALRSTPRPL